MQVTTFDALPPQELPRMAHCVAACDSRESPLEVLTASRPPAFCIMPSKNVAKPAPPLAPLKKGQKLDVRIEGLGSLGEGLATVLGAQVFVPKAAPGDRVQIEILDEKKGRFHGRLLEIREASSTRVEPKCRHFDQCGGCDFQHLSYDDQMAWKMRMTKHWIRRSPLAPQLDKIDFVEVRAPEPYGYRHRVRLQVLNGKLHFFIPHSHKLIQIEECPILEKGFFEALSKDASPLESAKDWTQSFSEGHLVSDSGSYKVGDHDIRYGPKQFTQGNLRVNELMWSIIKTESCKLNHRSHALDLFCGVGNWAVGLRDYFAHVVGVESDPEAIKWAQRNDSRIEWIADDTAQALKHLAARKIAWDLVVIDPPRMGSLPSFQTLAEWPIMRILSVSCHLETCIRDILALQKRGPWKIDRWYVVDLFPQTNHIESIVVLSVGS